MRNGWAHARTHARTVRWMFGQIPLVNLVSEKESRVKEGMLMMGLKDSVFWSSWFVSQAVSSGLITLLVVAISHAFGLWNGAPAAGQCASCGMQQECNATHDRAMSRMSLTSHGARFRCTDSSIVLVLLLFGTFVCSLIFLGALVSVFFWRAKVPLPLRPPPTSPPLPTHARTHPHARPLRDRPPDGPTGFEK